MNTLALKREHLHIINSINTSSKVNHYGYQPVATGETAPHFYLPVQLIITKHTITGSLAREAFVSLQDLLDYQQPLVFAFLGAPGQAAVSIYQLEKLHNAVQNSGGKLLIFTAVEPKYLRKQLKQSDTLNILYDKDNAIAELFGLYDIQNPLWQWVSGIEEEEQSLPALYVISPDSSILFSYVDYNFSLFAGNSYNLQTISKGLLNTIYEVSAQHHYQTEAYKLVS